MKQFARFKAQHPDCILLFRMGDFYETFDEDAITTHKALGITLTERQNGIPMAGVPYHAVEGYLARLIEQGYRVALCDQVQDPKDAKGLVDRAVTRVVTPGTLIDEALLDEARANHVAAIHWLDPSPRPAAVLAAAELSTGRFTLVDLPAERVVDEVVRLGPSELLYAEPADGSVPHFIERIKAELPCVLTARPSWTYRQNDARDLVKRHYGVNRLEGFGLDENDPIIAPAGALIHYLQETQAPDVGADAADTDAGAAGNRLAHLEPPRRLASGDFVTIDAATLRSLEIERTMRTGAHGGSLLSVLQRCVSPMGKRLLRQWICYPLRDREAIEGRHRAVAALIGDVDTSADLVGHLAQVQDVARIVGRTAVGRATPRDLVALGRSVGLLDALRETLGGAAAFAEHLARLTELAGKLNPLAAAIAASCVDTPPQHMREGGLMREGVDAELDEARTLMRDANDWLAAYQGRLVAETAIPSLKVGYNKVFGYYIEITHAHARKVPDAFSRQQTLKNAERYITPELKEFEDRITAARTRAIEREKQLFDQLCAKASARHGELSAFAGLIAELDVLACFADLATRYGYTRPELVDEPVIDVRAGRHPVLDRTLDQPFVPNDCLLGVAGDVRPPQPDDAEDGETTDDPAGSHDAPGTLALITGPNMAGKSTYIRQVALIALLAHTGCYVPAERAVIGLVDRIFTRIGASDELHAGQSTFMVEMTETANILHHATRQSLVVLDEIGRGTSTLDGLSLAWSIAECLAERGCRTLFATHYHELTSLAERLANVRNLHVAVREWGDDIVFLYRILAGRTDRSYGIHVAKIAGLPAAAIERARELLENLTVQTEQSGITGAGPRSAPIGARDGQMALFTEYLPHPVVDELRSIDLEGLTPLEAFDHLRRLRQDADSRRHG